MPAYSVLLRVEIARFTRSALLRRPPRLVSVALILGSRRTAVGCYAALCSPDLPPVPSFEDRTGGGLALLHGRDYPASPMNCTLLGCFSGEREVLGCFEELGRRCALWPAARRRAAARRRCRARAGAIEQRRHGVRCAARRRAAVKGGGAGAAFAALGARSAFAPAVFAALAAALALPCAAPCRRRTPPASRRRSCPAGRCPRRGSPSRAAGSPAARSRSPEETITTSCGRSASTRSKRASTASAMSVEFCRPRG